MPASTAPQIAAWVELAGSVHGLSESALEMLKLADAKSMCELSVAVFRAVIQSMAALMSPEKQRFLQTRSDHRLVPGATPTTPVLLSTPPMVPAT